MKQGYIDLCLAYWGTGVLELSASVLAFCGAFCGALCTWSRSFLGRGEGYR